MCILVLNCQKMFLIALMMEAEEASETVYYGTYIY
jgi:hypothetical protein